MSANGSSWPGTVDLSTDSWLVEAGWGSRPDDPADCARRFRDCLVDIAALDPLLSMWFYDAEPVGLAEADLRRRIDANWGRSGTPGTVVSLRNGSGDDLTVATISVSCGATAVWLNNWVELMPPRPAAVPRLYQLDTMLGLFDSMIEAWQPEWCRVRPRSLADAAGRGSVRVLASWIAYLGADQYRADGPLPAGVSTLDRPGGTVFVLAPSADRVRLDTIDRLGEHLTLADGRLD